MRKHGRCIWVLSLMVSLGTGVSSLRAQGFGVLSKKTVTIKRLLPPTVNLKGKKIRIEATGFEKQPNGDTLRSLLKVKLVTLVQKDPRFILNETSPETILKFTITNFYVEKWTVGTGTSATTSWRGKMEVAYQAIDNATKTALDSENLTQTAGYDPVGTTSFFDMHKNAKKEAAERSENETTDQLVDGIVDSMSRRIAPTNQPFDAPLPGKKLEPLSSLASSDRWGAVEEQAEKMDKFPKPEDDSYRLYLIALAKEAQAYDLTREANERDLGKRADISPAEAEKDFQRAQKYLDEASKTYKDILASNPKEKEFRPGDTRTEEALAIYAKIDRFKQENAKAVAVQAAGATVTPVSGSAQPHVAAGQVSPLDQVLDFCSRGMAAESIKDYIESPDFLQDAKASDYHFSFSRDSVRLNDTCKTNAASLQKLIRDRLGAGGAPAPTPAKTPVKH